MRHVLLIVAGVLLLGGVLALGLRQAGDDRSGSARPAALTREEVLAPLSGPPAPPPELAALHARGSRLLAGGLPRYRAELRRLRGHPVVVNLWASWCGPCRYELPFLQELGSELGREVAFLGVDVGDERAAARQTAREFFMPYPSIEDPRTTIRADLGAQGLPSTAFYTADGRLNFLHQGAYRRAEDLREDIRRYALREGS